MRDFAPPPFGSVHIPSISLMRKGCDLPVAASNGDRVILFQMRVGMFGWACCSHLDRGSRQKSRGSTRILSADSTQRPIMLATRQLSTLYMCRVAHPSSWCIRVSVPRGEPPCVCETHGGQEERPRKAHPGNGCQERPGERADCEGSPRSRDGRSRAGLGERATEQ